MELWLTFFTILNISSVLTKKYITASDESIENLLYYKDCRHKSPKGTEPPIQRMAEPPPPPPPPPQPIKQECSCPKMCCTMCCANDCGAQSFMNRQNLQPMQNMPSIANTPLQPQQQPHQPQLPMMRSRKKKKKLPFTSVLPIRRDFGYTKDFIRGLISKDNDIKKIVKDLVSVTMKKVNLMDQIRSRRAGNVQSEEVSDNEQESSDYE